MGVSNDLIAQFVKATNDKKEEKKKETIVLGTIVVEKKDDDDVYRVKIDGSELTTPISTTTNIKDGDRVTVMIKNHTAIVTGNLTSPAARTGDVDGLIDEINEVEILVADKVSTSEFEAQTARIDALNADNVLVKEKLLATEGLIEDLEADNVTINEKLTALEAEFDNITTGSLTVDIADARYAMIGDLDATDAYVHNLEATYTAFEVATTNRLNAIEAVIDELDVESLDARYANIDFSNIGEATMQWFYANSGLIKDVVIDNGTITGEIVGVTIKGDLIEGGTVKADKLVIKGTDGLYYKLNTDGVTTESEQTAYNSINGRVIAAKSITATKISVSDLVAFGATIGGFKITNSSIHSGTKSSADNTTRGVYLDSTGQMSLGDTTNFLKYYKDSSGNYKLEISADSISFGSGKKSVETAIADVQASVDNMEVGGRNLLRDSQYNFTIGSNSGANYPIDRRVTTEDGRTFYRVKRVEVEKYPTKFSIYNDIPLSNLTERLTGKEITFSFLARCSHTIQAFGVKVEFYINGVATSFVSDPIEITPEWKRFSSTLQVEVEHASSGTLRIYPSMADVIPEGEIENFYLDICEYKVEKGNKATDWTPALEDVDNSIAAVHQYVDDIKIGGRNLLPNTGIPTTITAGTQTYAYKHYVPTVLPLVGGSPYTISADVEILSGDFNAITLRLMDSAHSVTYHTMQLNIIDDRIEGTVPSINSEVKAVLLYAGRSGQTSGNVVTFSNIKFEKGHKATDWTPAPEDIYDSINDVQASVDNMEVGGRNLLKDSRLITPHSNDGAAYPINVVEMTDGDRVFHRMTRTSIDTNPTIFSIYNRIPFNQLAEPLKGNNVTFSCLIRCSHVIDTRMRVVFVKDGVAVVNQSSDIFKTSTEWNRISFTMPIDFDIDITSNSVSTNVMRLFPGTSPWMLIPEGEIENFYLDICEYKVEKGHKATDWTPAPEDVDANILDTSDEIRQEMVDQNTAIISSCNEIILSALESYVQTSNYDEFKQTVESQLVMLADEISLNFTTTTEQIASVNADLQDKFNTVTKFFTFDVDGLTIGQTDSPYKIVIDNDRYSMFVGDVEVLWIDIETREVHTPELTITDRFRMLGYQVESDAEGNVNWEYIGGE